VAREAKRVAHPCPRELLYNLNEWRLKKANRDFFQY
jgi:hypothetical protein